MRACSVCSSRFPNFLPLPTKYFDIFHRLKVFYSLEDFETLNVGQYSCPVCQCSDRDRLYAIYIASLSWSENTPLKILDIAPAPILSKLLRRLPNTQYRSADLYSDLADDKVDITDLNIYQNDFFDFIVCSHVLEHVPDDAKAMSELYRVLAPGGKAILMVPILTTIRETDEGPDEESIDERWARFGQDDHVRMYAKEDFLARLCGSGFTVDSLGSSSFGEGVFKKHGITDTSVLYVGRK